MPNYVALSSEDKLKLLGSAKHQFGLSWNSLALELGCSKSLLFAYRKNSRISEKNFILLCNLAKLSPKSFHYSVVCIDNDSRRVSIPEKVDEVLRELLGSLAGDGHVSELKYQVNVCGHKKLDRDYIVQRVVHLVQASFNTVPFVRENDTTVYCRFYSKPVVEYLCSEFKLPLGRKRGRLRIPKQVMQSKRFLVPYLRGLFDTDGSIYRHHKKDIALDITSVSPNFRKDVITGLKRLGFHPVLNGKNVQLYRQGEIRSFFSLIRPANKKHLIKYGLFNKLGYLPKSSDIFAVVV